MQETEHTPPSTRPELAPVSLAVLVAGALLLGYNATFWAKGAEIFAGHPVKFLLLDLAILSLTCAFFALFAFRWTVRPFLAAMLILTAVTSYYMDTLGVIIDRDMIQNVATTTFTESKHLLTPGFALHVLLWGVLPAAALFLVRVRRQRWLVAVGAPVAMFALGLGLAGGLIMVNFKTYSAIARERKDLMGSYQPGAPLVGAVRYVKMMTRSASAEVAAIGTDAHRGRVTAAPHKPTLTILVAGETARAANFGLNGYARDTSPELAARGVINFPDVTSCGTATAVSLPCMFSRYTRDDYSYDKGVTTESLLDVLAHAGFAVEWWDNNTGSKGVADRVPTRSFTTTANAEFCPTGECTDGIFLGALDAFLPTVTQDTVLVLHMIGSHGPTYHLRYPPDFARFAPACGTAEFKDCTPEEIVNAYDNTILYTDHILAAIIDRLAAERGLATSLLYVSDHGESLGENGLYLHGAPYFMAPETQTHVPMVLWMSDTFETEMGHDAACLDAKSAAPTSHDALFHSVLGMLDVETEVRDPALDLFTGCESAVTIAGQ